MFTDITYYKLQIRKHFVYYIISLGGQGYRVGGIEEILDQALMILRVCCGWKTMGKKSNSWPEWACAAANAMAAS